MRPGRHVLHSTSSRVQSRDAWRARHMLCRMRVHAGCCASRKMLCCGAHNPQLVLGITQRSVSSLSAVAAGEGHSDAESVFRSGRGGLEMAFFHTHPSIRVRVQRKQIVIGVPLLLQMCVRNLSCRESVKLTSCGCPRVPVKSSSALAEEHLEATTHEGIRVTSCLVVTQQLFCMACFHSPLCNTFAAVRRIRTRCRPFVIRHKREGQPAPTRPSRWSPPFPPAPPYSLFCILSAVHNIVGRHPVPVAGEGGRRNSRGRRRKRRRQQ